MPTRNTELITKASHGSPIVVASSRCRMTSYRRRAIVVGLLIIVVGIVTVFALDWVNENEIGPKPIDRLEHALP